MHFHPESVTDMGNPTPTTHTRIQRARTWAARTTLTYKLIAIHKETWIPALVTLTTLTLTGLTLPTFAAANAAAWLTYTWHQAGAYHRNAEDTMLTRFHYRWTLTDITDPTNTPRLVAVHITRATRPEARHIRANQGRHALGALGMTLTIRPKPEQTGPKWLPAWILATQARYGFQTATDPQPAMFDANATEITFGQERLPTEVRAVIGS